LNEKIVTRRAMQTNTKFLIKRAFLGIIFISGFCIALFFILRFFGFGIPFIELIHEERIDRTKWGDFFSIGIYFGDSPLDLYSAENITNPVLTAEDINDIEADFVADPFLIRSRNRWYLFFEAMNRKTGHGDLGLAYSDDTKKWKYEKIILDEPFHLSYPDVFSDGKDYYMIPEAAETKTVRLYKALDFPFKWKFEKILIEGLDFLDPTIFKYENKWWLFIETNAKGAGTLRLYFSDKIHGPWKEHPKSPVICDNPNIARPGGRVIFFDDRIFRVAQDDWPTYGNKLRIFEIDRLTTSDYKEHEICDRLIVDQKEMNSKAKMPHWRSEGMHQLDVHKISKNKWIACVDGVTRTRLYKQWVIKFPIPFTKTHIK
jgi:hypothetical protein